MNSEKGQTNTGVNFRILTKIFYLNICLICSLLQHMYRPKWTTPSRNPIYEYQLSWNLINAYQEVIFFIFECVVSHIIMYFQSPLYKRGASLQIHQHHHTYHIPQKIRKPKKRHNNHDDMVVKKYRVVVHHYISQVYTSQASNSYIPNISHPNPSISRRILLSPTTGDDVC